MNEMMEDKELPESDDIELDDELELDDEYCPDCGELLDDCTCESAFGW